MRKELKEVVEAAPQVEAVETTEAPVSVYSPKDQATLDAAREIVNRSLETPKATLAMAHQMIVDMEGSLEMLKRMLVRMQNNQHGQEAFPEELFSDMMKARKTFFSAPGILIDYCVMEPIVAPTSGTGRFTSGVFVPDNVVVPGQTRPFNVDIPKASKAA